MSAREGQEKLRQARNQFNSFMEPLRKNLVELYMLSTPKYLLNKNGNLETVYDDVVIKATEEYKGIANAVREQIIKDMTEGEGWTQRLKLKS